MSYGLSSKKNENIILGNNIVVDPKYIQIGEKAHKKDVTLYLYAA